MEREVCGEVQATILPLRPLPGVPFGRGLRLIESGGQRAVVAGATVLHVWDTSDKVGERVAIVSLLRNKQTTQVELAPLLGYHRNTLGRLAERAEQDGMTAMIQAKPGPQRAHKVTPEVLAVLDEGVAAGLGCTRLRRLIGQRTGVSVSEAHVCHLLKQRAGVQPQPVSDKIAEQIELEAEVEAAIATGPAGTGDGTVTEVPVILPERTRGAHMGAALCFPALNALGLLDAAQRSFRLPNADLFGVRAVTLTLFFMAILQTTTVEAARFLRRWEFGALIGSVRAPVVRTLRRKLAALVSQGQALEFGRQLARRWVEQAMIATAYLYIDGHMKVYTGKRKLQEVWNSSRRMPLPGFTSFFVGDQRGRPLLLVTEEASSSLAQAMPKIVAEIRQALGQRRFTVLFDRGGYDSKLFQWLLAEGVDFITYQVGEPKLADRCFARRRARFGGRRVYLWIAEDTVTIKGSGPWRRIVVRRPDGHQLPILTSLGAAVPAALIACSMLARWRQENFFRYMRQRMGLDQIVSHAFQEVQGDRLVSNPRWRELDTQIKARRRRLSEIHAQFGQAVLDDNDGRWGELARLAQELDREIEELKTLRKSTAKQIPLASAGERQQLHLEQKAIVDRIKITAYNAEEWLLERLLVHYPHPDDARALLRSFFQLPGELRSTDRDVQILIDPPDNPLQRRVLRGLCADLNQLGACYPGTALPLTYQVEMHHSEPAA